MQSQHTAGNRMAIPSQVSRPHFLYKTESVALEAGDIALVVNTTMKLLEERGLNPAEIESYGRGTLHKQDANAGEAFGRLVEQLGWAQWADSATVLVCEWSTPHTDPTFAGKAFVSAVLNTGPSAYVLQTLHTELADTVPPEISLVTSTCVLKRNNVFVFDPTTPHWAVPVASGDEQLLVLLQIEVPDDSDADRAAVVSRFVPVAEDLGDKEVFNGYY